MLPRLKTMRKFVAEELEEEIPASNNVGRPPNRNNVDMSTLKTKGGNSREYTIARLKRDAPEIAERVINKEISASEGAKLAGLGTSVEVLQRLCGNDLAVWRKIEKLLKGELPHGGDRRSENFKLNNIQLETPKPPAGTNRRAAMRRLDKDAPELLDRVIAGELSPHAAMLEAGFRKPKTTIRMDNATSAARTILKHMERETLLELLVILNEEVANNPESTP